MILLSELSRRRIRSVNKLIRVGRNEVVVVMRVDPDKGVYQFRTWLSKSGLGADALVGQATLICQSVVSRQRRWSSARSSTKRARRSTRSLSKWRGRGMCRRNRCTKRLHGHYIVNTVTRTRPLSFP